MNIDNLDVPLRRRQGDSDEPAVVQRLALVPLVVLVVTTPAFLLVRLLWRWPAAVTWCRGLLSHARNR